MSPRTHERLGSYGLMLRASTSIRRRQRLPANIQPDTATVSSEAGSAVMRDCGLDGIESYETYGPTGTSAWQFQVPSDLLEDCMWNFELGDSLTGLAVRPPPEILEKTRSIVASAPLRPAG